ncbi:putative GIY-YIG superfamily endonuclease [Sphingobium xenophagum]|uniref:GIY-YIG superfamily endonuclease n=1 Tax=Sphingobium xenophagum TaxID=121428 RepID=A0ABU1WXH3_SPHXE|nr:putative GIY-YIG superfamily endonuclease [Sphingobium xenophagum]
MNDLMQEGDPYGHQPSYVGSDRNFQRVTTLLVPRKLASQAAAHNICAMRGGWTYIMTNKPRGVLYVGVTSSLHARVDQHRRGGGSDFCRLFNLHRLVLAERHDHITDAIAREKATKHGSVNGKSG